MPKFVIFKNKGPRLNTVLPCISWKPVIAPRRQTRPFAFKDRV